MKVSYALGSIIIILAIAIAAIGAVYIPNSYGYTTTSDAWNGLGDFTSNLHVNSISNFGTLSTLNSSKTALFLVQPVKSFTAAESQVLKSYLMKGGLLVVGANNGSANQLLSSMGTGVQISAINVLDPVLNYGQSSELVLTNTVNGQLSLNNAIVLDSPVLLNTSSGVNVLHSSSAFSDATVGNLILRGPLPLIASQQMGNGTIVVIGTPGPLLNAYFDVYGNQQFIASLVGSRTAYIDTSHWSVPLLTIWQNALSSRFSPLTLAITEFLLFAGFLVVFELWAETFIIPRSRRTPIAKTNK
jgi:hypothetical protein